MKTPKGQTNRVDSLWDDTPIGHRSHRTVLHSDHKDVPAAVYNEVQWAHRPQDWTERALEVIADVPTVAAMYDPPRAEGEHLLLALLDVEGGVADETFQRLRVNRTIARREIESSLVRRTDTAQGFAPFSHLLRSLFVDAREETDLLADQPAGTGHLLLALLHHPESVAGTTLAHQGVTLLAARKHVQAIMADRAERDSESD